MAQPQFQVDRTTALYERPAMDIVDATTFAEVKQAIASAFAPGNVEKFLKSVERSSVRIARAKPSAASNRQAATTAVIWVR